MGMPSRRKGGTSLLRSAHYDVIVDANPRLTLLWSMLATLLDVTPKGTDLPLELSILIRPFGDGVTLLLGTHSSSDVGR